MGTHTSVREGCRGMRSPVGRGTGQDGDVGAHAVMLVAALMGRAGAHEPGAHAHTTTSQCGVEILLP